MRKDDVGEEQSEQAYCNYVVGHVPQVFYLRLKGADHQWAEGSM